MGRPSKFTQTAADEICKGIAKGKGLREICSASNLPSMTTVMNWLRDEKRGEFLEQYTRAREDQADYYADEIITIADTEEDAAIAKVRIDARKWAAGKRRPKVYGDKIDVNQSGQITVKLESDTEQL